MIHDVAIIGGGMAGASLAARLAPKAQVLLLETEDQPGYHATGRSAALYEPNYGNAVLQALTRASGPFFRDPVDIGTTTLLSPRGILMVATEAERQALQEQERNATGLNRISTEEALSHIPILRRDAAVDALYGGVAEDIDVHRMLQGFLSTARKAGAQIHTKSPVTGLSHDDGIWHVGAGSAQYSAHVVVNAAGAWADGVAEMAGALPRGLTPLRRSAALLPAPDIEGFAQWPIVVNATETWYAKPEAGQMLVSPAEADPCPPMDAWPDDMVLAEGIDRFSRATTHEVTRINSAWAGLRTFAKDKTPLAGFDADRSGFFWLAGQGGYGIQTAPALSQLACDLVLGQTPDMDSDMIAALDPNRF